MKNCYERKNSSESSKAGIIMKSLIRNKISDTSAELNIPKKILLIEKVLFGFPIALFNI